MPLVSLPELKTYLGLTGTSDDLLLASCASNASVQAEQDTGRTFAVTSNHTERYSTNGQASLTILDVPYSDSSRVVLWNGAALIQDQSYWLLPDRRNTDVATTIQLYFYNTGRADWYKASPTWFDSGMDNPRYLRNGGPNDLTITGVHGHPALPLDVKQAITELAAWFYFRAKSGASGYAKSPTGEDVSLAETPPVYQRFVANWKVTSGVGLI